MLRLSIHSNKFVFIFIFCRQEKQGHYTSPKSKSDFKKRGKGQVFEDRWQWGWVDSQKVSVIGTLWCYTRCCVVRMFVWWHTAKVSVFFFHLITCELVSILFCCDKQYVVAVHFMTSFCFIPSCVLISSAFAIFQDIMLLLIILHDFLVITIKTMIFL